MADRSRSRTAAPPRDAGAEARARAARGVDAVLEHGRSLDAALAEHAWARDDQALISALVYGVLRERRRLEAALAPRLKKKPQSLLAALLLVGIYQLAATRIPPHAAVHASVAAAPLLGLGKARGLVNAILRAHAREPASAPTVADAGAGVYYSHPDWLIDAIRADWPDGWQALCEANNTPAPMHLRVNARRARTADYHGLLRESDLAAETIACCRDGLTLADPVPVSHLPGFAAGQVSVQDGAAQLAADLIAAEDGQRVLDACAAPGNKSAHLLERADIDLLALDIDPARSTTCEANLERLGLRADVRVGDAAHPERWWDGRCFDRILLDAPCSGTGVIRRHPDIKWLRRAADIDAAAARQIALLRALWPTLAPAGRLVYATCSILRAEGAAVVARFLDEQADARIRPINDAGWGAPDGPGRRLAPGEHGFDGFFYAILESRSPP